MLGASLLYGLAWLSFAVPHSLLAVPGGRRVLGRIAGQRHRMAYNLIATVHLGLVFAAGLALFAGDNPRLIPLWLAPVGWAMVAAGGLVMLQAARAYDSGLFTGTTPTPPDGADADLEPLVVGGWNARVRHPLYFAGLLILWGLAQTAFGLATAIFATAYIVAGAWAEERKLEARYGQAYRRYRQAVPMLLPRWRPARIDTGPGPD